MTYNDTLARLLLLKDELDNDTCTSRVGATQEFMKLKRSLAKFPEHKERRLANARDIG